MSQPFAAYDRRHYRTADVGTGYGQWAATYDETVDGRIALQLLEMLTAVPWRRLTAAVDLGCGTGQAGAWLRARGVGSIDGVDGSPEMLERAARKGLYGRLLDGDVRACGLETGAYDLAVCSLVACHVPDLGALYAEAGRLVRPDGLFVLVDYHPFFLLQGIPTHFQGSDGEPLAIENVVHLFSDHVDAASAAGWSLLELRERLVDEQWIAAQPSMGRYANLPVSFAMVWQR